MNEEQFKNVKQALVEFVIRVSKGQATSETEVVILPKVAEILLNI